MDYRSLWRQLQELVNPGYLQEFVANPGQLLETKVRKGPPEVPQPESRAIQYREIDVIFGASPIEGTSSRERVIYINKAHKSKYPTVLTSQPLAEQANIILELCRVNCSLPL